MSLTLIIGKEKSGKTLSLLGEISTIQNVCNSNGYTLKFVHAREVKRHDYSEERYNQFNFVQVKSTEEMYNHIKDYKEEKNGSFEGKTHIFIGGLSYFDPAVIPLLRTLRSAHVGVTATMNSYITVKKDGRSRRLPYPTAPALLAFADNIKFAFGDSTQITRKPRLTSFVGPMGSGKTLKLLDVLLGYDNNYGKSSVLAVKHFLDAQRNHEKTYIVNQNKALEEIKYEAFALNDSREILKEVEKHPSIKVVGIDETNFFGWDLNKGGSEIKVIEEEVKDKNLEELLNFYYDSYGMQTDKFPRDYFVYKRENGRWWFVKPDLFDVVNELYSKGIIIVGSGLELSCFGEPFSPTHYLLAISDKIIKNKAVCEYCEKIVEGEINSTGTVTQRLDNNGQPTSFKEPLIKVGAVGESYFPVCWQHHQIRDKPKNLGLGFFNDLLEK